MANPYMVNAALQLKRLPTSDLKHTALIQIVKIVFNILRKMALSVLHICSKNCLQAFITRKDLSI